MVSHLHRPYHGITPLETRPWCHTLTVQTMLSHRHRPDVVSHPHRPDHDITPSLTRPWYHILTDQTMVSHPHRPDHGITPTQTRPWYHTPSYHGIKPRSNAPQLTGYETVAVPKANMNRRCTAPLNSVINYSRR